MACSKYYGCNSNTMIKSTLLTILDKASVLENVPMREHTTFKTGGNALFMVMPGTVSQLTEILRAVKSHNMPYYIIGRGSNLLVSDRGLEGVVIKLGDNFSEIEVNNTNITVKSGASLSKVANEAYNNSLGGIEFLSGIPGTCGGAFTMNAGAYDNEICDFTKSVDVLTHDLCVRTLSCDEMEFGYRTSRVAKSNYIVLGGVLKLYNKEKTAIKETMQRLNALRREKQPLDLPNAGSTFKRPLGNYAGALIEKSGLKGFCINDACVSKKHCGFVVNNKNATSKDIYLLILHIQQTVFEKTGVMLECEVKMLGDFS